MDLGKQMIMVSQYTLLVDAHPQVMILQKFLAIRALMTLVMLMKITMEYVIMWMIVLANMI